MNYYPALSINELPTVEEVREQYKGARCLELETHPEDKNRVIQISYKKPCMVCGKHHHMNSEAHKRCLFKMFATVSLVISEQREQEEAD